MITILREFAPADRYLYDFKVLTIAKGWAQLDTKCDASYYGHWINPMRREIFGYCEGDTTLIKCDTDSDLQVHLAEMARWHEDQGHGLFRNGIAIGIDPGFNEVLKSACVSAGIGQFLH